MFIASDANGIWVYECNQDYDADTNHCCGVFIQYFLYEQLFKYKFILNYVNHNYSADPEPAEDGYHKVGCVDCDAYILHDFNDGEEQTYISTTHHGFVCEECGYAELHEHDDTAVIKESPLQA